MQFVKENTEYRKRCMYLQQIISLGKENQVWHKALAAYFDSPMIVEHDRKSFSKN